MLDRQSVLTLFEETSKVLVFNLDFIPEDKMGWKPAPEAKSALEIVNHLAEFLDSLSRRMNPQAPVPAPFVHATSRNEAKQVLAGAADRYAQAVRGASPELLGEKFRDDMPLTLGWMVTASTIDAIHHAGQIAYIQTLLGDNELHFDPAKMPAWAVA